MTDSGDFVARRVAADLAAERDVWIAPELSALRALVPTASSTRAALTVVGAHALDAHGLVHFHGSPPPSERVWVVLDSPVRILERLDATSTVVERAYCDLGVLDIVDGDLVIIELAVGVSAIDLQAHAEPTLKISSRVNVMRPPA